MMKILIIVIGIKEASNAQLVRRLFDNLIDRELIRLK